MDVVSGDDPQIRAIHRGGDEKRGEKGEVVSVDEDGAPGEGLPGRLRNLGPPGLDVLVQEPPAGLGQPVLATRRSSSGRIPTSSSIG